MAKPSDALRNGLHDSKETYPSDEWASENVGILFTSDELMRTLVDTKHQLSEIEKRIGVASDEGKAFERLTLAKSHLQRLETGSGLMRFVKQLTAEVNWFCTSFCRPVTKFLRICTIVFLGSL